MTDEIPTERDGTVVEYQPPYQQHTREIDNVEYNGTNHDATFLVVHHRDSRGRLLKTQIPIQRVVRIYGGVIDNE